MMARTLCPLYVLFLLVFALVPKVHAADCFFTSGQSTAVNFNISSPITIPFDLPAKGTVLGTPRSATPFNPPDVNCDNGTQYGVVNKVVPDPPQEGLLYIYPTGVPGVGYQLIHANDVNNFMGPYPGYTTTSGVSTFSIGTTLQFVQTGVIANGASLPAGTLLATWQWGTLVPEYFVLSNTVRFQASACTWNDVSVTLPTLSTQAFSGPGSTAGQTAFGIPIHCPTGSTSSTLVINLSARTVNGYSNVLRNQIKGNKGGATGVGVELVDPANNPVVFTDPNHGAGDASVTVGSAPTGDATVFFFAHYYATDNNVTAGDLEATATFTMTYN